MSISSPTPYSLESFPEKDWDRVRTHKISLICCSVYGFKGNYTFDYKNYRILTLSAKTTENHNLRSRTKHIKIKYNYFRQKVETYGRYGRSISRYLHKAVHTCGVLYASQDSVKLLINISP